MRVESKHLKKIWSQVPPDYYQVGLQKNFLQRIWHGGKWKVLLALIPQTAKEVLDVGSAGGHLTSRIKRILPTAKVIGLDIYGPSIKYARNRYRNIRFVVGDAHQLPFKDQSFDVIICTETIEHVGNPPQVLAEIKRCLTPSGMAIIEMDRGNFLFNFIWFFWTHFGPGRVWRGAHINRLNETSLEQELKKAEFNIKRKIHTNLGMAVFFQLTK